MRLRGTTAKSSFTAASAAAQAFSPPRGYPVSPSATGPTYDPPPPPTFRAAAPPPRRAPRPRTRVPRLPRGPAAPRAPRARSAWRRASLRGTTTSGSPATGRSPPHTYSHRHSHAHTAIAVGIAALSQCRLPLHGIKRNDPGPGSGRQHGCQKDGTLDALRARCTRAWREPQPRTGPARPNNYASGRVTMVSSGRRAASSRVTDFFPHAAAAGQHRAVSRIFSGIWPGGPRGQITTAVRE